MTMINFEPTSLCAIRPSGETRDFVSPGISRVVAGRCRAGVEEPDSLRRATMIGLLGAVVEGVVAGVSLRARPLPTVFFAPFRETDSIKFATLALVTLSSFESSWSWGVLAPSVLGVEK